MPGKVPAYGVRGRQQVVQEDVALSSAESGSGYGIPSGAASLSVSVGRLKALVKRRVFLEKPRDSNALSSGEARLFDTYQRFHRPESGWLADALAALAEVDDEIAEENLPQVSDATKAEAERIIKALGGHPPTPTVYPTQDAEITLHFKSPDRPDAVVILLSDSVRADSVRADCYAYVGGRSRRAHYDTSSDLPDAFVREQLRRLTRASRSRTVHSLKW